MSVVSDSVRPHRQQPTRLPSLGFSRQEYCSGEKEMATHSSILAWKSPWTEEPGGLQSMELRDWACVHEGGGRRVGSNKVVELKKKKKKKNTGVGYHFLLQCMKVKSESEVTQSCPTLHDPMDCSLPGSSIHGISQARVLEWGAIAFSSVLHTMFLTLTTASVGIIISNC